jgi:hypothetical protein
MSIKILKSLFIVGAFFTLSFSTVFSDGGVETITSVHALNCAGPDGGNYPDACTLASQGYACTVTESWLSGTMLVFSNVSCTKSTTNYSATAQGAYTLVGNSSNSVDSQNLHTYDYYTSWAYLYSMNSPFIYLHNAPEGNISVNLSSALDTYSPLPSFTTTNGWDIDSKDGSLFVDNKKVDNLFYELALTKLTLNRNGKNFSSKKEIISYLKTSSFLDKMGFSEEEKKNTLGYIIPEIQEAEDTEYYYLTVLTPESVAEVSTLNVTPKPNRIDRHYYSIYPTNVPVRTEGDFKFPVQEKENGFTVKETGELLVQPDMFVFFK